MHPKYVSENHVNVSKCTFLSRVKNVKRIVLKLQKWLTEEIEEFNADYDYTIEEKTWVKYYRNHLQNLPCKGEKNTKKITKTN